jgi:hypothetical protein
LIFARRRPVPTRRVRPISSPTRPLTGGDRDPEKHGGFCCRARIAATCQRSLQNAALIPDVFQLLFRPSPNPAHNALFRSPDPP